MKAELKCVVCGHKEAVRAAGSSSGEKFVWEALEEARQSVKHAVKKQMEGEMISQDLLNFYLKSDH